jgi:hypothetical protein
MKTMSMGGKPKLTKNPGGGQRKTKSAKGATKGKK